MVRANDTADAANDDERSRSALAILPVAYGKADTIVVNLALGSTVLPVARFCHHFRHM